MPRAAVQLGMDANPSIDLRTDDHTPAMEERRDTPVSLADVRKDYFIRRNGVQYAGTHLIIDLWGARRLDDLAHIEETLRECVRAAGATRAKTSARAVARFSMKAATAACLTNIRSPPCATA